MTTKIISSAHNQGIILGQGGYGTSLAITKTGKVSGSVFAIYAPPYLSGVNITNAGTVSAVTLAVGLADGGILNNSGSIHATTVAVALDKSATMINTGQVSGGSDYGIGLLNQSSLNNSGTIKAVGAGVYAYNGSVTNSGSIYGTLAGIVLHGGLITNLGDIAGQTVGVGFTSGTLINHAGGLIAAKFVGVVIDGSTASLVNAGTITGSLSALYEAQANVSNSGLIAGNTLGLALKSGYLSNSGSIAGSIAGAALYGGTLNNTGKISGSTIGVAINGGTIFNTGDISGGAQGIDIYGGNLINSGTISGGTYAVYSTNALNLTVTNGAVFGGKVFDQSGNGTITTGGPVGGTLAGVGSSILGFTSVDFAGIDQSSPWTIKGNLAGLASGQAINNFLQNDTLVITDFAAATAVDISDPLGVGIVLSNGATTETLHFSIPFNVPSAAVYTENGATYLIETYGQATSNFKPLAGTISVISESTSLSVTPGEGFYADGVTIESAVTIDTSTAPAIVVPRSVTNPNIVNFGLIQSSVPGYGIYVPGFGTVTNFGSISTGILLDGTLINSAVISGKVFVGTIINSGIISNKVTSYFIENSGSLTTLRCAEGVLMNSSDISGGVYFGGYGPAGLTNSGHIFGPSYGVYLHNRYLGHEHPGLTNFGSIGGQTYGVLLEFGGAITNAGTISGNKYAIQAGNRYHIGQYNPLYLTADPGAVFNGAVRDISGEGKLNLAGSTAGSLDIGTSFSGFATIDFAAGSSWTLEGAKSDLASGQTISGFFTGDTIILDNFVVNPADTTYVAGKGLEITDTRGNTVTLDIAGNFTTANFNVADPPGDTTIEFVICYLRGTNIATSAGERPIESLAIGDAVITKFGGYRRIKWIGRQSYAARFIAQNFDQIPVKFVAGSLGPNLPKRDLFVSPGHSMLIGGVLILAKSLVNGITITQTHCPAQVDYFQIEFETHDCLLAEGIWSESYADTPGLRAKFHNANEFYALHPNHLEPATQQLCAPRPIKGPGLAAALRPLLAHLRTTPGKLHGCIDEISPTGHIRGWAWDSANPHLPVLLEILAGNQLIASILACDYRADLAQAGIGRGHCSFTFTTNAPHQAPLTIRRAQDHAEIFPPRHQIPKTA